MYFLNPIVAPFFVVLTVKQSTELSFLLVQWAMEAEWTSSTALTPCTAETLKIMKYKYI